MSAKCESQQHCMRISDEAKTVKSMGSSFKYTLPHFTKDCKALKEVMYLKIAKHKPSVPQEVEIKIECLDQEGGRGNILPRLKSMVNTWAAKRK